jgi:hypothetical protein
LAVSTLLSALERLNGHTIGSFTDVGMIRHEV